MTRIAILGAGLIGAAAARHLALAGHAVTLIGPPEPARKATHQGPFASHYDEARITRRLDADPFWAEVSTASIARYDEIERQGGVRFFHPAGTLMTGPEDGAMIAGLRRVATASASAAEIFQRPALARRFPFLDFPEGMTGFFEADTGHLNPRRLLEAQIRAATAAGARLLPHPAAAPVETGAGLRIVAGEAVIEADEALVAAGAWTNALLPRKLAFRTYARTVALLETDAAETARLSAMPSLIWRFPDGRDPYLLPPVRYPDGRMYLKIGGDPEDRLVEDKAALDAWFRSGGSAEVGTYLEAMARAILPGLRIAARRTEACAVMFTASDFPFIDRVSERLTVAAGGCGAGAKCSDELGRLAAEAVLGRTDKRLKAVFERDVR